MPAVRYTSAFGRYRPNAEVEVGAWRERNDAVGRIGGWRVYGREASAPESAPGKPTGEADARANGGTPGSGGAAPGHGHGR